MSGLVKMLIFEVKIHSVQWKLIVIVLARNSCPWQKEKYTTSTPTAWHAGVTPPFKNPAYAPALCAPFSN